MAMMKSNPYRQTGQEHNSSSAVGHRLSPNMEGQGFPLQDKDRIAGNVSDHPFIRSKVQEIVSALLGSC